MLLVGAGLLVKSLWHLVNVNPGFTSASVLTADVPVPLSRYPEGTQIDFYARLYDRLRRLPGVRTVGAINILPLSGNYSCDGVQIEGRPVPEGQGPCAEARSVNPDYFAALTIPLVRGRLFDARDTPTSPGVVVINQAMADRFWPGEDPIGRRMIYNSRRQGDSREVVGIIGNVRHFGLDTAAEAEFYTPQTQQPSYHTMTLAIRADGALDAGSLVSAVRGELAALDAEIPLYGVHTLDERVGESVAQPRFRTLVLVLFAAVALVLALIGVYGVASRAVAQRTQEIGVRVALGARPGDIVHLVMGQALGPVAAGVAIGLAGAFAISRTLTTLLFDVQATDLSAYALAPAALLITAVIATSLPARRAANVDPLITLRAD
jgi:putative ABC transport system permease protein